MFETIRMTFEKVEFPARKNLPCPKCRKKVRRQKTFSGTVNPFNKDETGKVRDRSEVFDMCRAKADEWKKTPELCSDCEE